MMASCANSSVPITGKNGTIPPPVPVTPSVSSSVTLSLTVCYIIMYCILFLGVYVQLWLILLYNYKKFSFQTVFLFLCACWSALRATLFSFYFKDTVAANELPLYAYWLLYCFPVCLQFFTLCLLTLYFAQVMFKARPRYAANPNKYIYPLRAACLFAVVLFAGMNISCAIVVQSNNMSPQLSVVKAMVVARVLVNDLLFVICGISLAYCIVKISKTTSANILLESQGTSVCQAVTLGILIVLLYASRALYNLIAISPLRCDHISSFNFNWYNVSDQADLVDLGDNKAYLVFGVVLFIWELLPTSLTVYFFRVRKSGQSVQTSISALTTNGYNTRVYFFDNPHRYDSEEDLAAHLTRNRIDSNGFPSSASMSNSANPRGSFLQPSTQHHSDHRHSPRTNHRQLVSPGRRFTLSTPPVEKDYE